MNDDWRPSDDLDAEIFAHQPTSRLMLSEYGHLAAEINDDSHSESTNPFLSSGGRGQQFISNVDLSVQLRNTASIEIEMGKLLTSNKILPTNDDDDGNEGRKVAAEIRAMITNAGLNNYEDGTAFRNSTARTILADSAPKIIHEKKYPILMDKKYFQFRKSKQEDSILKQSESSSSQYDDVTTSTESGPSSFASTSKPSTSTSTSYSSVSETSSVIGFYNHMKPGDAARHQLSIGIGKETLLKPKEIYFIKKVKQSDVKKARKEQKRMEKLQNSC